jgi:hypothetical protein
LKKKIKSTNDYLKEKDFKWGLIDTNFYFLVILYSF